MIRYKLVDQQYRTRAGMPQETYWHELSDGSYPEIVAHGDGNDLCTDGVIHSYASPLLAAIMNPVHANIDNPRCIEIEASEIVADDGTKAGHKRARMLREIPLPTTTRRQRTIFTILAVRAIPDRNPIPSWESWADQYLAAPINLAKAREAVYAATEAAKAAVYAVYAVYAAKAVANEAKAAAYAATAANEANEANAAANAAYAIDAARAATIDFATLAEQAIYLDKCSRSAIVHLGGD